ncbi:uroporphyrinogen-III synthase [Motilimonas pumila]|nr:uroporphyrinogen-III synthase [Motilimonas pumila]
MATANILVTRPQPHGAALANYLRQQGHQVTCFPLLAISENPAICELSSALTAPPDIIIAISDAAVTFSHQYLHQQGLNWPSQAQYLAVGQRTAATWYQLAGVSALHPAHSDSENLLALPQLNPVSNARVLILKGNGGRPLIEACLTARGAEVTCVECYLRQSVTLEPAISFAKWQDNEINSVIITSGEMLTSLMSQVPSEYLEWMQRLTLIVASQRIKAIASSAGFNNIWVADGASHQALSHCIKQSLQ